MALKELGNEHFKAGRFQEAEQLYSQAIQQNSSDPKLFSNRALTRVKLEEWQGAETDSRKAIELYGPKSQASMKPYYYLSQALLKQRHPTEALDTAKYAYKICLELKDNSAELLSQFILRTKQSVWQGKETSRLREQNETLAAVEDLLEQQLEKDMADVEWRFSKEEIGATGRNEEKTDLEKEAESRRRIIRQVFEDSEKPETKERVVPDYLIDGITFEVMHDPVITPSGVSYERVGLLRHLKLAGVDPLTREPLTERQLIPNVALRNACSEFLGSNGWAVDY